MKKISVSIFLFFICVISIFIYVSPLLLPDVVSASQPAISVDAIYDDSIIPDSDIAVFMLNENQYKNHIKDSKSTITPIGKAPMKISDILAGVVNYIGVGVQYEKLWQAVQMPNAESSKINPKNYYIDDMYAGLSSKTIIDPKKMKIDMYFIKWYRVFFVNSPINIIALFLDSDGNLDSWDKFYPSNPKYDFNQTPDDEKTIWGLASKMGIIPKENQKKQIFDLLKRGGKVYFPRNGKANVFYIDQNSEVSFKGRLEIDEVMQMKDVFALDISKFPTLKSKTTTKETKGKIVDDIINLLPKYSEDLYGNNEIRISNPNDYSVYVGIRDGNKGTDFLVQSKSSSSVYVPNGVYKTFFVFKKEKNRLMQGENIEINNNGVEIKLVYSLRGNYPIKEVK